MKFVETVIHAFRRPVLTKARICFAVSVALLTDGLQFGLGPFGWILVDQGLDVVAMVLVSWAIGFHMLLLPTFVIEFIPGPDMLPTWTGCTAAVIMLRKRAQQKPPIDITSEVTRVPPIAPNVEHADSGSKLPPPQALRQDA
jgi:hypothetical protein